MFSTCSPVNSEPAKELSYISLLDAETSYMLMNEEKAVSTVSFYETDDVTGLRAVSLFLRERVAEIIQANPWLGGRLVKHDAKVVLAHDNAPHPESFEEAQMDHDLSYKEIQKHLGAFVVPDGATAMKHDTPLFKVVFLKQTENKFGVLVSLSHVIGDGHTFYKVHSMLGQQAAVTSMNPIRCKTFPQDMVKSMGKSESAIMSSGKVMAHAVAGLISMTWKKAPAIQAFCIDHHWLGQQKEQHKAHAPADVPFVSTNDIVTSWFMRETKADFGLMAMNFRNRVPDIGDSDAGNYENAIVYRQPDFASPGMIRRSLKKAKRASMPETQLPGWATSIGGRSAVVTNWASFFEENEFAGSRHLLHLPVVETMQFAKMDTAILFMARKGELAVMVLPAPGGFDVEKAKQEGSVGAPLNIQF